MTYTIIDGEKAQFIGEGHEFTFECDPMDIDTAYGALAENLEVKDNQDLILKMPLMMMLKHCLMI